MPFDDASQFVHIGYVTLFKRAEPHGIAVATREIVVGDRDKAGLCQGLADMRTDKARAAGHQNAKHRRSPRESATHPVLTIRLASPGRPYSTMWHLDGHLELDKSL